MIAFTLLRRLISRFSLTSIAIAISLSSVPAQAAVFTLTSPTSGGVLPSNISNVGGVVLDMVGSNGTRVVSQLSANSLFQGWPGLQQDTVIGTQSGFTSSILSTLGGNLTEVGIRFTLLDGDNSRRYPSTPNANFDFNQNFLLVNGINFGNWSEVKTLNTDGQGNPDIKGFSDGGFRGLTLDTGWFFNNDQALLTFFYDSLVSTGQVKYEFRDLTPGDQYLDFKQGIASNQTNIGQPPTVVLPEDVPEPVSLISGILGLSAIYVVRQKRKQKKLYAN